MDVGDERHRDARLFQDGKSPRRRDIRHGKTHDVATGIGKRPHGAERRRGVMGIGIGHGLNRDGCRAADGHTSDRDGTGNSACGTDRHIDFLLRKSDGETVT